jgi:hypothetical protein
MPRLQQPNPPVSLGRRRAALDPRAPALPPLMKQTDAGRSHERAAPSPPVRQLTNPFLTYLQRGTAEDGVVARVGAGAGGDAVDGAVRRQMPRGGRAQRAAVVPQCGAHPLRQRETHARREAVVAAPHLQCAAFRTTSAVRVTVAPPLPSDPQPCRCLCWTKAHRWWGCGRCTASGCSSHARVQGEGHVSGYGRTHQHQGFAGWCTCKCAQQRSPQITTGVQPAQHHLLVGCESSRLLAQ